MGHMQRLRNIGVHGEYAFMSSEETIGPTAEPDNIPNVKRKNADALITLNGSMANVRSRVRTFLIWILNPMRWSSVLLVGRLIHRQRQEIEGRPIYIVLVKLMERQGQIVSILWKVWTRQMQGREWVCDQFYKVYLSMDLEPSLNQE